MNYDRHAYVQGIDLNNVDGFEIDTIRPDATASRTLTVAQLAEEDGEFLLGTGNGNKKITLNGHFNAGERWDYEMARDELLGLLEGSGEVALEFEQSGQMRRYFGAYETINFTYKERGFVLVTITFRATRPFGTEVTPTNPITAETFTGTLVKSFTVRGNVQAKPRLVLSINSFNPIDAQRTISVIAQYGGFTRRMDITQFFQDNQTLVIDVDNNNVTLNGQRVPYVGQLPKMLKDTTITIQDNATSRNITADLSYNGRYL